MSQTETPQYETLPVDADGMIEYPLACGHTNKQYAMSSFWDFPGEETTCSTCGAETTMDPEFRARLADPDQVAAAQTPPPGYYFINPDFPEEGVDRVFEPTRFVYLIEDEPTVGTVDDYAKALREAHYAGLSVSQQVWTFTDGAPVAIYPTVEQSAFNDEDYASLNVFVLGEHGIATIDGRA